MATSLTFTGTMFVSASTFTSASQSTTQSIVTGGALGSRIYGISAQSSSSGSVQLNIAYSSSTIIVPLYSVVVAANSGVTGSVAPTDIFGSTAGSPVFQKQKDANGAPYFNLPTNSSIIAIVSGSTLQRILPSASLSIVSFGENY